MPLKASQPSRSSSIRSRRCFSLSSLGSRRNNPVNEATLNIPSQSSSRRPSLFSRETTRSRQSTVGPELFSWLRPSSPESAAHRHDRHSYNTVHHRAGPSEPLYAQKSHCMKPMVTASNDEPAVPTPARTNLIANSPDSLSSQDSSLWTDSTSLASSKSSTEEKRSGTQFGIAQDPAPLLGGFVPVSSSMLSNVVDARNTFQFDFDQKPVSIDSSYMRPPLESADAYANIGVALADPPSKEGQYTERINGSTRRSILEEVPPLLAKAKSCLSHDCDSHSVEGMTAYSGLWVKAKRMSFWGR